MNEGRAPVLTTARLTLRAHTLDDAVELSAMWADPRVVRHIGGRPFTAEEVWTRLLRSAGLWTLLGYGYWIISLRDGGGFVGEAGYADFRRDLSPSFGAAPEAGWALAADRHGCGYAREALEAIGAWGDQVLARRTVCMIAPANAASRALASRCGYTIYAETAYKGAAVELYERPPRAQGAGLTQAGFLYRA